MTQEILSPVLFGSLTRNLGLPELIQMAETLKQSGQTIALETLYSKWLEQNPDHPLQYAVLFNYSVALGEAGKLETAQGCLERAITLNPEFMPAYINLGRLYEQLGSIPLAVVKWSAALSKMAAVNGAVVTHKVTALNQCARALESINQDESAESMLRQSLELDTTQREVIQHLVALRQRQFEHPALLPSDRVSRELLMRGLSPLSAAALSDDPLFQLALAAHYNQTDVGTPAAPIEDWPRCRIEASRLRVGYLSSDLREHAVGFLMTEVFELHDREAVETFAYYCGPPANDRLHEHFKTTAEHWHAIDQMDDRAAADQMLKDGIQILVDLNGYTREARLKLVAMRPAPVIVNWLGFPGTMGSPYHHYLIADEWIIPQENELYYSERVLRLPCYQPSARTRVVATTRATRQDAKLPEDAVVYCCFNGTHKITRFTFERWLSVLEQVPNSVLWLLSSTPETDERLRAHAVAQGISGDRVIFATKLANPSHLARYPLADLFLDTTPYGAHTTCSDALWAGVPVLTYAGRSFASRVCASLVAAAGIPELICRSPDEFVNRAVALGRDREARSAIRNKLAEQHAQAVLFDIPGLVRNLELRLREAWSDFENGSLPRPDLTNLEAYLEVGLDSDPERLELQALDDYDGWWLQRLSRRHRARRLSPDPRLVARDPVRFT